jgi:hypothetical protein
MVVSKNEPDIRIQNQQLILASKVWHQYENNILNMALVQKGLLFDCLTTVNVMLERSEASQGGVDFDTFLHSGQYLKIKTIY